MRPNPSTNRCAGECRSVNWRCPRAVAYLRGGKATCDVNTYGATDCNQDFARSNWRDCVAKAHHYTTCRCCSCGVAAATLESRAAQCCPGCIIIGRTVLL